MAMTGDENGSAKGDVPVSEGENRASRFLKAISRSGAGGASREGLESSAPAPLPNTAELVERLRAEMDYVAQLAGTEPDHEAIEELAKSGKEGLDRLNSDGPAAQLDERHLGGLEAVIRTDGSRPVAFVRDDFVDPNQPSLQGSPYLMMLGDVDSNVRKMCRATGRVDDVSQPTLGYRGTAFVVGEDLVMTNRHVLKEIVSPMNDADEGALRDNIFIDFRREAGPPKTDRRYRVTEIVYRGIKGDEQHRQPNTLNFDELDIAILRVDVSAQPLPEPLPLAIKDFVQFATKGRQIFIVGFPGSTRGLPPEVFAKVFEATKSFKRLAPGEILDPGGEGLVPHDPRNWVMTHDVSTLGGNSGSAVWDLEGNQTPLLGIHFAGEFERQNWAHPFERLGDALSGVTGLNLVN